MKWSLGDIKARRILKGVLAILGFLASSANGEIYTWIDSRGTAHYTNSLYEVPDRYRAGIKILDTGEKKETPAPQPDMPPQHDQAQVAPPQGSSSVMPAARQAEARPTGHYRRWERRHNAAGQREDE